MKRGERMGNNPHAKKDTKNAFLKMSQKKAPVPTEKDEQKYNIEESVKEAKYLNQVIRRDKWQG